MRKRGEKEISSETGMISSAQDHETGSLERRGVQVLEDLEEERMCEALGLRIRGAGHGGQVLPQLKKEGFANAARSYKVTSG